MYLTNRFNIYQKKKKTLNDISYVSNIIVNEEIMMNVIEWLGGGEWWRRELAG